MAIAENMPRQEGNQMHTILSQRAGAKRPAPKREAAEKAPSKRDERRGQSVMPKLKTHRGAAKRFKKTGTGKFMRGKAFKRTS